MCNEKNEASVAAGKPPAWPVVGLVHSRSAETKTPPLYAPPFPLLTTLHPPAAEMFIKPLIIKSANDGPARMYTLLALGNCL